jgi:hypothetical protein
MTQAIITPTVFFPAQDFFELGGDRTPRLVKATLVKADSPSGIDIRKGYGLSGATTVPTGEEPSDIEFLIEIWKESVLPEWYSFAKKWLTRPVALPPGGIKAMALPISHPGLNNPPINVTQVLRHNCTALLNDGYGLWSCTVSLLQFRLPKIAMSKPLATLPSAKNARPTAQDANDVEKQQLQVTLQNLVGS